jgi:purine-binding chemotaxis protein CheW
MSDISKNRFVADEVLLEQEARILKERAIELSREDAPETDRGSSLEVVEFELAGERYGLALSEVREVCLLKQLTPVPCTPAFVTGIMNLRGEIVTVVDIRQFFELPALGITDLNRIIVIHSEEMQLGLLADRIHGAKVISVNDLQPSLPTLTGIRADYMRGVSSDRLIILAAAKMLSDPSLIIYEEVEG